VHSSLVPLMVLAMVLTDGSCGAFAQAEEREYEPDVILLVLGGGDYTGGAQ